MPGRNPWLDQQPFELIIEATYGTLGTTRSDSVEVTVLDTCFTTTVTPQNIVQLTTYLNAPSPTTRSFDIFTDVVSDKYSAMFGDGTGYDLCGGQSYDIQEIVNNQQVPSDLVTIDPVSRELILQTSDIADTGLKDMLLCVTLFNFDVSYCQPFAALVSDCEVTNLQLYPVDPPGTEITYEIQSVAEETIVPAPFAAYTPSECLYDLEYTALIFNSGD